MNDWRNIINGSIIPSETYSDQPYIVVADDGAWVCEVTTSKGSEGADTTHILITRSYDRGKTWSDPVSIEPEGQPESSYGVFLKTSFGRIYCFYGFNADNIRSIVTPNGNKINRVDMGGYYVFRYSDDNGVSWSERFEIPIRETEYDRENPFKGSIRMMWNVGRAMMIGNDAYVPLTKIREMLTYSEGWVLFCPGLDSERDASKLKWELRPDGDVGLRTPQGGGPIAEEQSIVSLSDGAICCVYRTIDGFTVETYSHDKGKTWETPQYKRFDNGRLVRHNRAANFMWKLQNGKYLYWFNNHFGKDYQDRNPVWLTGGIEQNGRIRWTQPDIVLYDDDPQVMISYPDLIEDDGKVYISETQKRIARVHEIPEWFLQELWNQFDNKTPYREGVLVDTADKEFDMPKLPVLAKRVPINSCFRTFDCETGFSIEFETDGLTEGILFNAKDDAGRGICLEYRNGKLSYSMNDSRTMCCWESDQISENTRHITVIVDGGPKVIMFVVDGLLHDGDGKRQYGWGRYNPFILTVDGAKKAIVSNGVSRVRIYDNALTVSRAIGNYNSLLRYD